jgi:O6-methylguanine-DNA--protein-cysteine methyltransferase
MKKHHHHINHIVLKYTNAVCSAFNNLLYMAGSFHERVWITLAKNIGPGQTVSYGELAKMVNSPGL